MKINERVELTGNRRLWNHRVYAAFCRKADGDQVVVISSKESGKILSEYSKRWKIETLYGVLKTGGFRLEYTHLTQIERVSKLLSLLTIAVIWAILAGELQIKAPENKETREFGKEHIPVWL